MAVYTEGSSSAAQLKIEQTTAYDITRHHSKLFRLLTRARDGRVMAGQESIPGTPINIPGTMGAVEWKFRAGRSGGAGLPNLTTGSVTHFGNSEPTSSSVRITPFHLFVRVAMTEYQSLIDQSSGLYWSTRDEKTAAAYVLMAHLFSSIFHRSGKFAHIATVTTGVTVDSASTHFEIEVDNVQCVPEGADIEFRAASGAAISNAVPGIMTGYVDTLYGKGKIKVQFPTYGSSFTIADTNIVSGVIGAATSGGTNLFYADGLQEGIGTGTHPRSEGQNVQNTELRYKSVVMSLADGKKVNRYHFESLLEKVRRNASARSIGSDNAETMLFGADHKPIANKLAFLTHPDVVRQLNYNYEQRVGLQANVGVNYGKINDEGYTVNSIDGVPIIDDDINPTNRCRLIHMGAVGRSTLKDFGPLLLDGTPGFRAIPGTINAELLRDYVAAFVPVFRDCLGEIVGAGESIGMTPDELAGVTV